MHPLTSHRLSWTHLLVGLACFWVSPALAQPLQVTVQGLDAISFARALSAELGRPVELRDAEPAPPHLHVEVTEGGFATLELRTEDGHTRQRVVEAGSDRSEAPRLILLVASNLVREPAEGLIAAPAPLDPAPMPPRAGTSPRSVPAPPETVLAPPAEDGPGPSLAEARPLRLGVAGMLGLHTVDEQVSPFGSYGLSLLGTIHPNFALGVTQLTVAPGVDSIEGLILGASGTPVLEAFGFVDTHVQIYGQAGVTLQFRSQTAVRESVLQVAPRLAAGARFWATDWFSIGVEVGVSVIATEAFLISGIALPQGTMPGTLGLSAEFHIAP